MGSYSGSFEAAIVVKDVKDPEALFRALLPESGEGKRFSARVKRDGESVIIEIEARDPTALRAAVNSYMRLLVLIGDVEERI